MDLCQGKTGTDLLKEISILDAVYRISGSWNEVDCSTITKCFSNCGFKSVSTDNGYNDDVMMMITMLVMLIIILLHYDPSQDSSLTVTFRSSLTLVMLNPDIPCLCKQCRSRSVGFWRSQLIWICTVCHKVCEFIAKIWIKWFDWLKIRSGCGKLIYSAGQGLILIKKW